MYGLPSDFDASFFVSTTLEQICFTENQVSLIFTNSVRVAIEGAFRYEATDSRESSGTVELPVHRSSLMRLLGHRITDATGETDGTLLLRFEGGESLCCYDDSKNTESYHIAYRDKVIHV